MTDASQPRASLQQRRAAQLQRRGRVGHRRAAKSARTWRERHTSTQHVSSTPIPHTGPMARTRYTAYAHVAAQSHDGDCAHSLRLNTRPVSAQSA
eukprot:6321337-Prymnesium_polylepis.2